MLSVQTTRAAKLQLGQLPSIAYTARSGRLHHQFYSTVAEKTANPTPNTSDKTNIFDIRTKVYDETDIRKHDDNQFITHPLFPHPTFSQEDCLKVGYEHRPPRTFGDKMAFRGIELVRGSFDFVTGYKKPKTQADIDSGFKGTRYEMTEGKWLTRCIFLESIAGVPGAVASFIRHLHSLRLLKRDKAWIETLLDEAFNERMHLLTFIKIGKPSWFTRTIIYVGQGVFCNLFFLFYLANPKYCHRFVGYLEEEAVSTYTHFVHELQSGKLPKFENIKIPTIAWQYWPELTENSSMLDLILRIRADEAKHREVNHTLANLDQRKDRNPFGLAIPDLKEPQPESGLKVTKPHGWEKEELKL
ncbi:Alternative oxidase, mitochondrial precursor (SHAM-sensitive terminal oxidase) (STO1) [Scheffersomyces stipitis CBS 6054]|uniref:Alternative oxidase, mitochondrial n=1 Tax=Scheffersomyces stipitis (strain ATCC 58785 / CBS 6054 / NBRC 10063 / NRRL Y-11545) TaxID=322104 RepID=AOX_PICST|nr:Alternative oxidase, mitochondrial precursor (SHAM-sensitive terminal oxidase) (STO1) [Scheffersomyces stipitis CBS 6054]Q9P414.2 RecName: Full=Alternative oxidase, mitochondrial; AltName: Full=SHAM-sensitive terminal oxidase; Flags: Precursor [Scheffersomyces stipitis CBS 6054]AAF97475.2 SHAM-sensitive terminal oxidase [Scheffersomyces stipitis]ABN65454.2 Alternative oxidase, mitochondrial precursor (SHAM-sensitive terminal oxidase) (STO1) [Scheffersomyces stipitis CBS 6054]KAG2733853.1 hyp